MAFREQRVKQTLEELDPAEKPKFLEGLLRIEIWINIPFGALAYRMLLLNAGQKPMSINTKLNTESEIK